MKHATLVLIAFLAAFASGLRLGEGYPASGIVMGISAACAALLLMMRDPTTTNQPQEHGPGVEIHTDSDDTITGITITSRPQKMVNHDSN